MANFFRDNADLRFHMAQAGWDRIVPFLEDEWRLVSEGVWTPVIFMTAHDDARTREQVETLSPVAYLQKPFEGRQLLEAVSRALARA